MIGERIAGQVPGLLDTPEDLPDDEDDGLSMDWPEEIMNPAPIDPRGWVQIDGEDARRDAGRFRWQRKHQVRVS